MKKIKAEHLMISLAVIFAGAVMIYYLTSVKAVGTITIIPSQSAAPSDILTGGDGVYALAATEPPADSPQITAEATADVNFPLDINKATEEELCALPGIGEVLAERIVAFREENGGFDSIYDILDVSGIGEGIFNKIDEYITV